jgi:signal transduction histidine kinase
LLHGRCTHIELQIRIDAGAMHLSIADNGSGIRPDRASSDGLGIRVMDYRSRSLGGNLHLTTNPTGGATLVVVVPISQLTDLKSKEVMA